MPLRVEVRHLDEVVCCCIACISPALRNSYPPIRIEQQLSIWLLKARNEVIGFNERWQSGVLPPRGDLRSPGPGGSAEGAGGQRTSRRNLRNFAEPLLDHTLHLHRLVQARPGNPDRFEGNVAFVETGNEFGAHP
jgi:hypothetical protein